jgi:hypothetical protein
MTFKPAHDGTQDALCIMRGCSQMHGTTMLRVEVKESDHILILKLEGRLTAAGADHVRTLPTRFPADEVSR